MIAKVGFCVKVINENDQDQPFKFQSDQNLNGW